jgi:NADPH-dependent 2,4-dienoyl-CoA reductase/sulfur reductase-like enzyme
MQKHLIIIGGVAAGSKAAAKARREDPDLKITLYTESPHISYSACALPYMIENIIKDQNRLLIRSPQMFKEKDNVDVHIKHKIVKIIPDEKKVKVENLETGEQFEDEYTSLLIATGSYALKPDLEGVELEGVFTLRTFEDGVAIRNYTQKVKNVAIAGAGFIGLEMTESFYDLGINVTLIELSPQVLIPLDLDMANQIQKYMEEEKNIRVILNNGIKRIIGNNENKVIGVETNSAEVIDADLVLLSVGVRPNVSVAKDAGIELGTTGAIKVNKYMQTSIPDIYAAGDCAEQINLITKTPMWLPLGSTANKQGRIAAINITGGNAKFEGVLGSHVSKFFDYTLAKTGLTEKEAQRLEYDYECVKITHRDKSGYYPSAKEITIKLVADKKTRKVLGAEIIGKGEVDKRINVIATALTAGMTIDELANIDLTYAPPYSPAIDPILIAAQQLQEKMG